jgi:hypothetical protein
MQHRKCYCCVQTPYADTIHSQTDSHEALTVPIKEDPGIVLKLQLPELIKLEDEEIPLDITGDYIWCISQCK